MELQALLSRGYFPRELPPTYTTERFGHVIDDNWHDLRRFFQDTGIRAQPLRHSLARTGFLRRTLTLPNPVTHASLCAEIVSGWPDLQHAIARGRFSQSKPEFNPKGGRSVLPSVPIQSALIPLRAAIRAGARVILRTDISRFYGSVYSHSLPWALHTKKTAKRQQRDWSLLGNRLDTWIRNGQDGQTVGIPIGPDASLVLAEVLLSAVDDQISSECHILRGLRYIDDYELVFESRSAAEQALSTIERILGGFGLELNPRKTTLEELPLPHESPWVSTLRSMGIRSRPAAQATDLVHLFDQAFDFARRHPASPVLRYTLGRLKGVDVQEQNRTLFQHLLLQCLVAEPATIASVLTQLIRGADTGWQLEFDLVSNALNKLMNELLPMGHGNEASWCLWGLYALELPVDGSNMPVISASEDPIVALLALYGRHRGLLGDLDTTNWEASMTSDDLYGDRWLLAYEALVKGWLPSQDGTDYISSEPRFKALRDGGVQFFDEERIVGILPTGVAPTLGIAPIFSG